MRLKRELDDTSWYRKEDLMHKPQASSHDAQHLEGDKRQLHLESAKQ